MQLPSTLQQIPEVAILLAGADHVDMKTVSGSVGMREFVAAMLGYRPAWLTGLYVLRAAFVRVLGMRQKGIPRGTRIAPDAVPMQSGSRAGIFRVRGAQEDRYWIAEASDTPLEAVLAVVVEPLAGERRRFYVLTVVHYRAWTGPVYFNLIRPFHHLVVGRMARAGARGWVGSA
jgi:hypothetical protein